MSYQNEIIEMTEDEFTRELEAIAYAKLAALQESDPYLRALEWADARGDSSGAQEMRKLLLSLYNTRAFPHSVGEVMHVLDAGGARLVFLALAYFRQRGATAELRLVGEKIKASGMLDDWIARRVAQA